MNYGLTVIEPVSRRSSLVMSLKNVLVSTRTKYQRVQIVELEEFGTALILDDYIQSTEADEYIYHESLIHPALITHPRPEKVLIVGGGEGASLREVLKHSTVSKAVMVDIDGELVELAKRYLGVMHRGSFDDPRSKVIIMDGLKYIEEATETYDVVILDLTDPFGSDIARALYSSEFYMKLKNRLTHDSVIVSQCGSSFFYPNTYRYIVNNIMKAFKVVREYYVWIPSFGYACNFIIASDRYDPATLSAHDVDELLRRRGVTTRYYSGKVHEALMKLPVIYNSFSMNIDRVY